MRAPVAPVLILAVAIVLSGCSQPQEPAGAPQPPTPAAVDEIAAAVPRAIARDGVLTIGTDPSYPPMEFIGADAATVEGADIDLATAVATVLGLTPAFEDEAFSALPDSVRTGRIELAVSSLTVPRDKPMRADAVLYFQSGNQLVASKSAPGLSASQLCGHTVATVEGSTQVRSLSRLSRECRDQGLPGITIEALSDQSQVTEAALSADVDGMLSDTPVAQYAVTQHPQQLAVAGPPFDPAPFGMLSPPAVRGAGQSRATRHATPDRLGVLRSDPAALGDPGGRNPARDDPVERPQASRPASSRAQAAAARRGPSWAIAAGQELRLSPARW